MGTNYYLKTGRKLTKICDLGHKHKVDEEYHIGKSSYGWYFTLHACTTGDGGVLDSLQKWKDYYKACPNPVIKNEYGETIEPAEMWRTITREDYPVREGWDPKLIGTLPPYHCDAQYPWHAEYGEKGLVHCANAILGDDGLYALMEGEFS